MSKAELSGGITLIVSQEELFDYATTGIKSGFSMSLPNGKITQDRGPVNIERPKNCRTETSEVFNTFGDEKYARERAQARAQMDCRHFHFKISPKYFVVE